MPGKVLKGALQGRFNIEAAADSHSHLMEKILSIYH
jgi:hypothetical protein